MAEIHLNFMGYARLNVLTLPEGFRINSINHRATLERSVDKIASSIVMNGIQTNDPARGLIIAGRQSWISMRPIQSVSGLDASEIPILEFSKAGLLALRTDDSIVGCGGSHRVAASKQVHSQALVLITTLHQQIAQAQLTMDSERKQEQLEKLERRLAAALQLLDDSKYWLVLIYDKGILYHLRNVWDMK